MKQHLAERHRFHHFDSDYVDHDLELPLTHELALDHWRGAARLTAEPAAHGPDHARHDHRRCRCRADAIDRPRRAYQNQ